MKLKQLELTLQRLAGFTRPRATLEQYQTPAPLAARLLYHALMKGDIEGKSVLDLGCGRALSSILLGREYGVRSGEGSMDPGYRRASLH